MKKLTKALVWILLLVAGEVVCLASIGAVLEGNASHGIQYYLCEGDE